MEEGQRLKHELINVSEAIGKGYGESYGRARERANSMNGSANAGSKVVVGESIGVKMKGCEGYTHFGATNSMLLRLSCYT